MRVLIVVCNNCDWPSRLRRKRVGVEKLVWTDFEGSRSLGPIRTLFAKKVNKHKWVNRMVMLGDLPNNGS